MRPITPAGSRAIALFSGGLRIRKRLRRFNMTGAAASHAVSGDALWRVIATSCLAALAMASWALRPQSRTLGVLFPAKMGA